MGRLILIAPVGKNGELGKNNDLIWHIKEDMRFFKEKTINHHVLMGKNTFLSFPSMLKDRTHIVLATNKDVTYENVIVLHSLNEALKYISSIDDDVYVIGGSKIYEEFIGYCDMMYLTEINDECLDANCYFPEFSTLDYDKKIIEENKTNNPNYKFVLYKRKTK